MPQYEHRFDRAAAAEISPPRRSGGGGRPVQISKFLTFGAMSLAACAATAPPINVNLAPTTAASATPATTATPATAAPGTAAAAPASPSPAMLRQAMLAGYHIRKLRKGTIVFCKEEAHLGSRFSTESCIDETQLEEFLIRAQDQRDKLTNRRGTGTDYN